RPLPIHDGGLQGTRVPIDRVLDDEREPASLHLREVLQKWAHVLCPENKTVHGCAIESDPIDLTVVRVHHPAEAGPEATDEPLPVERRDVRLVAGRDDHGLTPLPFFAARWKAVGVREPALK